MNDRIAEFTEKVASMDMSEYTYDEIKDIMQTTTLQELSKGKGDAYRLHMISNSHYVHPALLLNSFETLDETLKSTGFAAETKDYLQRMVRVYPQIEGSDVIPTYIDMEYPDIEGRNISLSSVIDNKANRYVLLDFWATWCEGCVEEMPAVKAAYEKYHDKGFEILCVGDNDGSEPAWKKAIEDDGTQAFRHVLRGLKRTPEGGFDKSSDISEKYAIHYLPTKFLIDREGKIIGKMEDAEIDAKLKEIFGE